MWHQLSGAGLSNVFLRGGVTVTGEGDEQEITYSDLDSLYKEIARAIAKRSSTLTGQELRFLRRRLGMSQSDVGALGGKSDQVAAKWEKGTLPVPPAEARLIRLAALYRFGTRAEVSAAVRQLTTDQYLPQTPYVFKYTPVGWIEDGASAIIISQERSSQLMTKAMAKAMETSAYEVGYTSSAITWHGRPAAIRAQEY